MILTSVVFPFARWGWFMCGGAVWAGTPLQRKPPLSCLTLRLFLAEVKMSSAIRNLSSHLFVSSSVFWKISHSDLSVFLACLPRHGFLVAKVSVIFFCFLLKSFPLCSSFHLPCLEFCKGKGGWNKVLPQYLLNLLESLKRRMADCGSSSQKGALNFGVATRTSLFPASILNVVLHTLCFSKTVG